MTRNSCKNRSLGTELDLYTAVRTESTCQHSFIYLEPCGEKTVDGPRQIEKTKLILKRRSGGQVHVPGFGARDFRSQGSGVQFPISSLQFKRLGISCLQVAYISDVKAKNNQTLQTNFSRGLKKPGKTVQYDISLINAIYSD